MSRFPASRSSGTPRTPLAGPLRALLGALVALALLLTGSAGSAVALTPAGGTPGHGVAAVVAEPKAPLTDAQWRAHVAEVQRRLDQAVAQGQETDVRYTVGGDREHWLPSRVRRQRQVADELYARGASVPNEGRAVFTGGPMGAGKTTVLTKYSGIDLSRYLVVSADDVKDVMCEHGMIPRIAGLTPLEASLLIQPESSLIANMIAARAYQERKNIIWDFSMSSRGAVESRMTAMRAAGYGEINAVFVGIPVEMSVQRADHRHRVGHEAFRNGQGCGGRYVVPTLILAGADPVWGSVNRRAFEETKDQFDHWSLYDSSGSAPVLVAKGTGGDAGRS
ncbi:zeta toxin family protein [Streptomyces sp. NPDC088725]|uniref:zeta toxin family protein n=1 Tax=Streptomyces sp. NPDC088725 TaxID=3365873 RepID=UPI0038300AC5